MAMIVEITEEEAAELEAYRERKRKQQERCRQINPIGRESQQRRSKDVRQVWIKTARRIKEQRPHILDDDLAVEVREHCRMHELWKSQRKMAPHSLSEILRYLRKNRRHWDPRYTDQRASEITN